MGVLWHQSGVNEKGEPFVQLFRDEEPICQMNPQEARNHAHAILEATEAAEQDAFLIEFFQDQVHLGFAAATQVLLDCRKHREAKGKKGPPSDPQDFMRTPEHKP